MTRRAFSRVKVSQARAQAAARADYDLAEALALTSRWAGYMLTIAEHSTHPDAQAAARWLVAIADGAFDRSTSMSLASLAAIESHNPGPQQ